MGEEVRIFDFKLYGLRPEKTKKTVGLDGEDQVYIACLYVGEPQPEAFYAEAKGQYITSQPLKIIEAAIVHQSGVELKLRDVDDEELAAFNQHVQDKVASEDMDLKERQHIIDQLSGLGGLLMRAAQLLQEDGNARS